LLASHRRMAWCLNAFWVVLAGLVYASSANAHAPTLVQAPAPQTSPKTAPDKCLAFASREMPGMGRIHRAALKPNQVKLTYVHHSTFVIESPKGVTVATDYNDYYRPAALPQIVTMNLAHDTHHTMTPDPGIKHVLKGWNDQGGTAAIHDLTVQDVRIRNVPTNIRTYGTDAVQHGNSIFVFEVAGLCIAHLGHLHHTLTVQHLAQLGQMDVVMIPVDGSFTLDVPGTIEVLKALKAPLIIPMHYFSEYTLGRFLDAAGKIFDVARLDASELMLARDQLPAKQKVVVLPPGGGR